MSLDDKLVIFEGIPRYTQGRHEYISEEFLQFPAGTRVFAVYQWFAEEYRREIGG